MARHSDCKHFHQSLVTTINQSYMQQYTSFLTHSDEGSGTVSPVISVHSSGKQGEIKILSVIARFPCSLEP